MAVPSFIQADIFVQNVGVLFLLREAAHKEGWDEFLSVRHHGCKMIK